MVIALTAGAGAGRLVRKVMAALAALVGSERLAVADVARDACLLAQVAASEAKTERSAPVPEYVRCWEPAMSGRCERCHAGQVEAQSAD